MTRWSRRVVVVVALGVFGGALSGCSLVSLDNLDGGVGSGGGAPSGASSAAGLNASSGDVASSAEGSTTTSTGGDGGSGAEGPSSSAVTTASGGAGPGTGPGAGGAGAGGGSDCPDSCAGSSATLCDSFDASDAIDGAWQLDNTNTIDSGFTIATEPFVSCPHSLRVDFEWSGNDAGGWTELSQGVAGQPTDVSFDVRIWRETDNLAMEGIMELGWKRDGRVCFLQVQMSQEDGDSNAAAQAYLNQEYEGVYTSLGGTYLQLSALPTARAWIDVGIDVHLGTDATSVLRVNGIPTEAWSLDDDDEGQCDDGPPDDGSVRAYVGAPYNDKPFVAYYDDFRFVAE